MTEFSFAGQTFAMIGDAALYWPRRRALLVADLHLEKASWFAGRGQMLPPYDSDATLDRLAAVVDACDPAEIWALGDSFHDTAGPERMNDAAHATLSALTAGRRMVWIAGNHDARAALPGERVDEVTIDGIILRHEAEAGEQGFEISGHFHPKVRVPTRARTLSRRCFVVSETRMILPAFGALTGGLWAEDPAILRHVGTGAAALVRAGDGALRITLRSRTARRSARG